MERVNKTLPVFLALCLSCCVGASPTSVEDQARFVPSVTATRQTATATSLPPADPQAMATPQPKSIIVWTLYSYNDDRVLVLGDGEPYSHELPFRMGRFYGYSPHTNDILLALEFCAHGAGPGGVCVSDLSTLNLESELVETLISDNVVEALWAPDGESMAYISATDQTYELHWRTPSGVDRILAIDVTFSWSIAPSGCAVAFTRESGYGLDIEPGLYVVDVDTGEEKKVSNVDAHGGGDVTDRPFWSPDSSEVVFSHWSGPEEPRLVLAKVDGTTSSDLAIDPELENEWWATIRIHDLLWHPDGDHLITQSAIPYEHYGPQSLVYYRIDREANMLVEGVFLTEVGEFESIIGWAVPGVSVWTNVAGEGVREIFLP